jgi:hypothetical protein
MEVQTRIEYLDSIEEVVLNNPYLIKSLAGGDVVGLGNLGISQ